MSAKLLEVNTETHICECCGKANLKRVAVIRLADGRVVRYGTTCAAKKLGKHFKKAIEMSPNTPLCGEVKQPGGRWVMHNTTPQSFISKEWESYDEQRKATVDLFMQATYKRNCWKTASFTEVLIYIMSTTEKGRAPFLYRTTNGKRIDQSTLDKLVIEGFLVKRDHKSFTEYIKNF